jgi:hypothetical protein
MPTPNEVKTCCICKRSFRGWGNNPEPFTGERACDDCDAHYVIPARIIFASTLPLSENVERLLKRFAELGAVMERGRQIAKGVLDNG